MVAICKRVLIANSYLRQSNIGYIVCQPACTVVASKWMDTQKSSKEICVLLY